MKYWVPITAEDLPAVFSAKELDAIHKPDNAAVLADAIGDIVASIREAVAQNTGNALPDDQTLIPRSLRPAALDILAMRLLKRFSVAASDDRRKAAETAEQRIEAIRAERRLVMDQYGQMPVPASKTPAIVAPEPAYGNDGTGYYPIPQ